jgi:hypothetical protein
MLLVCILPLIVGIIYCIKESIDCGIGDGLFYGFVVWFFTAIGCFAFAGLGGGFLSTDANQAILSEDTVAICALQDGQSVEGHFYLGSGYVDEELKYTYMYEVPGKGFTTAQIAADQSYVSYGNTPSVKTVQYCFTNDFLNCLFIPWYNTEYYITVPEGSIIQSYNIDLQ